MNHGEAIFLIILAVISVGSGTSIVQSTVVSVVNEGLERFRESL